MRKAWVVFRSSLQWAVGIPLLIAYVGVFAFLSLFVHHLKLDFILKRFTKHMVRVGGIRLKIFGRENIDWSKPYIILINHTNIFDHLVLYTALPQVARGVEREDHFRWPVHGLFLRRVGQIPIPPRGDTRRAIEALEKAKDLFRQNVSVAIAPEGTRTPHGELLPFKKGAFHLAVDLEADVLPVVFKGMYAFNKKNSFLFYPGVVEVHFLNPISSRLYGKERIKEFAQDVRAVFLEKLSKPA